MIVVKVWCLPVQEETVLSQLHKKIVSGMVSISLLGIESEEDFLCLFPPDSMKYGLGSEILIEIDGIPDISNRNMILRIGVSKTIGKIVLALYPKARVVCKVNAYIPNDQVWDSSNPDE